MATPLFNNLLFQLGLSRNQMEKSLIPVICDELYITHAEYQGCFVKIWANSYSRKKGNLEKDLQDYTSYSKDVTKLDLFGNTMYLYIWKKDSLLRVYRCQVIASDLITKSHTIVLIDYGQKLVVPFDDVRELTKNIDQSLTIGLSQRITVLTFLLSEYISKQVKSNQGLVKILCNKYYKYRRDFEVGGMTFVTLFDVDKKILDTGVIKAIDVGSMMSIAKSMPSIILSNNTHDIIHTCPIPSKAQPLSSFLKSQNLIYADYTDVMITEIAVDNNIILLTIRTLDSDEELLNDMLNALDRQNLKLAPVIEAYTSCLIVLNEKLVRAIILEVKIDQLYVDLVDYGFKKHIPRSAVFEIPPNLHLIEMRSLHVVLDKPNNVPVDKTMFIKKYFKLLPLKIDPKFGLFKVKLFKKIGEELINVYDTFSVVNNDHNFLTSKSPEFFSITEINEDLQSIDKPIETSLDDINEIKKYLIDTGMKEIEDSINKMIETSSNDMKSMIEENSIEISKSNLKEIISLNNPVETSVEYLKKTPIMTLDREILKDCLELDGSLIDYESPFKFGIRQYNSTFLPYMDQIISSLDCRDILTKSDIVKNMYVIFKNQSDIFYRAQIIDMDSNIENINLQLVDEGNKTINVNFNSIVLYNFTASDCYIPGQLVLNCSLYNMWFPVLDCDTTTLLKPYFTKGKLYNIRIIEVDEYGVNSVCLVDKDTNTDISNNILKSGIGQRLCAAMRTDENPYEEALLKGQSFLSYVYHYHFKLFIQPEPNIVDQLEELILEYLEEYSSQDLDINSLLGAYCLASGNNNQWFRCKVKNINEDSVIVEMFDIGLLTEVSLNQIRPIPDKLLKIPQLGLHCKLETNNLDIKIAEKTLYKITVKSINDNRTLNVTIKEHTVAPLSNPIVRGIEKISFVHVEGDLTYMHRYQDKLKVEKMSEALSNLSGKIVCPHSIKQEEVYLFESHGQYYRCVVKSTNSKMAVVHCIDFGFEKQIDKKKLQYLEDTKIALLPSLVIVVKTFPMAFNMSNTTFLANLSIDNDETPNALPNKTSSPHSQNELIKTLENGCLVKITHVDSDDNCWIVPYLFFDRLKTISQELVKMQSKIIPVETEIGSLCAALHSETKHWLRALILDKDEEDKNMLSIDSGERFKALKTIRLVSELQKLPNCALRCQIVSNVDVKTLLNKEVKCKLISYTQPFIVIEILTENMNVVETISTQSELSQECVVTISSFESFKEFWVKQLNDEQLNSIADKLKDFSQQPSTGTLVAAITDIGDDKWYECEVLSSIHSHLDSSPNAIVRIVNNGHICQTKKIKILPENISSFKSYRCCLKNTEDYSDIMMNEKLTNIEKTMMKFNWKMKTSSINEPYVVTLTYNGVDCIDLLRNILCTYDPETPDNIEINSNGHNSEYIQSIDETLLKNSNNHMLIENTNTENIILPDVEIVTVQHVDTFQYFYVYSKSLSELYMEKINSHLELCIIKLFLNEGMVGTIVVTSCEGLNCWCRAKIVKIHSNGNAAQCYLVDHGFYEDCYEFYKPTDFLCLCPPMVRRCSLYAPSLISRKNEIWYSNIDDMFKDIVNMDNVQFGMVIKKDGDPCKVSLLLDGSDLIKMLLPIQVQVTYINSLFDFKIKALSPHQKAINEFINDFNVKFNDKKSSLKLVENPIADNMYLALVNSNFKRVKFLSNDGVEYKIVDIDDTLDFLTVDSLYELPHYLREIPIFTMSCSLIINNPENYSLTKFCKLSFSKVTFIMCIITESDGQDPNLIKLYLDNKDVLEFLIND